MSRPLTVAALLQQLRHGIAATEKTQQRINEKWRTEHKHNLSLRGRRLTEKSWLAGVTLPLIFEMHFHKRAARSRGKAGKPNGPMISFIAATMQELGLPYDLESIARAYSQCTQLREERRRGHDVLTEIRRQV